MIRRRAGAAGIATTLGNHSLRATGITAYLKNGGTLEKAAAMANHASTRTTQLYGRRRDEVSLDVGFNPKDQERGIDIMRWGLVPFWAKDIKVGFANINAKAEGIENKPAFREAFRQRRCLVPVDNFFEWKKTGTGKQPYAIALADRQIMALAGLWETWRSPAGERIRSFAIITTTPNELCAELHNRMPVVLAPDAWPVWLGEELADLPELKALLAPYPSDEMIAWPVSSRVGNVKNNDPNLIEPIMLQ